MYSELEEQEANNIQMHVSAPEEGDCVRVIKIQNILCQKQFKNYQTVHIKNETGLNLSSCSY
jgi:hypothetical protein